jgi:hypothetical protein
MKSLSEFKHVTEEKEYEKFDMLVRAGLANKAQLQRIHRILDKMQEERPVFNNADRMILQNLFNKMIDLISNNKQIFQQTRRAVREENEMDVIDSADYKLSPSGRKVRAHRLKVGDTKEIKTEEYEVEVEQLDEEQNPPFVLVLKRKSVRLFPDGTKVALYTSTKTDRVFTVPFKDGDMLQPLQAEEVEELEERIVTPGTGTSSDPLTARTGILRSIKTGDNVNRAKSQLKTAIKSTVQNKEHGKSNLPEEVENIFEGIESLKKIVNGKSAGYVKHSDGTSTKVDHYTASAILAVHNHVNDDNKQKLNDMVTKSRHHLTKVADFAFKKMK